MARKSRREKVAELQTPIAVMKSEELMSTGVYGRLSSENKTEESLKTQMEFLYYYVSNHPDLILTDSYIDNGYSGTNFDRPEFVRLMDDVRSGRINCIVVKDLSRFGRDYIETGYYLETLFPHLNVRFIAITDDFDSFREGDIDSLSIPLKNMVNAMYAKDISKKQSIAAKNRAKREGVMPNGVAPYGYQFSDDKKMYLEDPISAPSVRMAFYWYAHDLEVSKIARRLTLIGAVAPGQYRNGTTASDDLQKWTPNMVYKILKHPVYTGDIYLGRTEQALYRSQPRRKTEPEEQIVRENAHFPCVTREQYELVQNKMKSCKGWMMRKNKKNIEECSRLQDSLKGMVYCAECGRRMYYVRGLHDWTKGDEGKEKAATYYVCNWHDAGGKGCGQIVYEDFLQIVAEDQLHFLIDGLRDREKLLKKLRSANSDKHPLISLDKKIAYQKRSIAEAEEKADKLYMDYSDGVIPVEDYQALKTRIVEEAKEKKASLKDLEERRSSMERALKKHGELIERLETHGETREFDPDVTREVVDRFIVSSTGNIEVRFNCTDIVKETMRLLDNVGDKDDHDI